MNADDPDPTKRSIMGATYRALAEHGYRDLTIQSIADEFEKSKSLLYYHYDSKEELLADFLDFARQEFLEEVQVDEREPERQLELIVDRMLPEHVDEERSHVQIALLELRAEAPHTAAYHEQYTEIDRALKATFADVVRRGIETGAFRDVDPEREAELLLSIVEGMRTRRLTTYDEFPIQECRSVLRDHVEERLLAPDRSHD